MGHPTSAVIRRSKSCNFEIKRQHLNSTIRIYTIKTTKAYCKFAFLLLLGCEMSGCLAMGVPYTTNPHHIVENALSLMHQHRPQAAIRLLKNAYAKFERADDKRNLAEVQMAYGLYHKYLFYVPDEPSLDTTANMDSSKRRAYRANLDYDKSEEYYRKAIYNFQEVGSYEGLSRAYIELATVYKLKKEKSLMVTAIDRGEEYYRKIKEEDPNAETLLDQQSKPFRDLIEELRQVASTL